MPLWEAIAVVGSAVVSFSVFIFALMKFAEPVKKFFSRVGSIEPNKDAIEQISGENQSQTEQIKDLQKDVSNIDKRLGRVEETLSHIKAGVECLLGTSLGYVNDRQWSEDTYRNLKNC